MMRVLTPADLKARALVKGGMTVARAAQTCGIDTNGLACWASAQGLTGRDGIAKHKAIGPEGYLANQRMKRLRVRAKQAVVIAGLALMKVHVDRAEDMLRWGGTVKTVARLLAEGGAS